MVTVSSVEWLSNKVTRMLRRQQRLLHWQCKVGGSTVCNTLSDYAAAFNGKLILTPAKRICEDPDSDRIPYFGKSSEKISSNDDRYVFWLLWCAASSPGQFGA